MPTPSTPSSGCAAPRLTLVLLLILVLPASARDWHVSASAANADDTGPGTPDQPLATIQAGADRAEPGDRVLVHPGVYREWVRPKHGGEPGKPIIFQSTERHGAVVKGSEAWSPEWEPVRLNGRDALRAAIPASWVSEYNPFAIQARSQHGRWMLGELFVNGRPYQQVGLLENLGTLAGTFHVADDGLTLTVVPDAVDGPFDEAQVEVVVRPQIFSPLPRGEVHHIALRGFVFEHAANQFPSGFWRATGSPQAGAVSTRSGSHWTIEHNRIRFAASLGLDCGAEGDAEGEDSWYPLMDIAGYHIIRYNDISDNGAGGIFGAGARQILVAGNTVERNNRLGWRSPEIGGMKFHFIRDSRIEGNLVRDNDAWGIWLDNVYIGCRVTRNVVISNSSAGIFLELGWGPAVVDHNIVTFNGRSGIYAHDASGITFAHNLLAYNAQYGIYARTVSDRTKISRATGERVPMETSDIRVLNNIFFRNYRGHLALPSPGPLAKNNLSDYNQFINDRMWPWDGMGRNQFVYHSNNDRSDPDALEATVVAALVETTGGDPETLRTQWRAMPVIDGPTWQKATGWDVHSQFASLREGAIVNGAVSRYPGSFPRAMPSIRLTDQALFRSLKAPRVEPDRIRKDFYGEPLEGDDVWVGPFQGLPATEPRPETGIPRKEAIVYPLWRPYHDRTSPARGIGYEREPPPDPS